MELNVVEKHPHCDVIMAIFGLNNEPGKVMRPGDFDPRTDSLPPLCRGFDGDAFDWRWSDAITVQ